MKTLVTLFPLAVSGNADAQYKLSLVFKDGKGIEKNIPQALHWAKKAYKNKFKPAKRLYEEILIDDFFFGSDIRKLDDLKKSVETICKQNLKCFSDDVWGYLDISKDGRLSLSEIARFQRNILKYAAHHQDKNTLNTEDYIALNLVLIIFLPITASSILHSFDYNNDGFLTKNEVLGDSEFSKLVGVNVNTLTTTLDFDSLGKKLKRSMNQIPF